MTRSLVLVSFIAALVTAAPVLADEPQTAIMSLQGTATVSAKPDMATISTGVSNSAETARAALDANNAAMASLLSAIKASGVASRDMQTSNFSIDPQYVYSEKTDNNGYRLPPKLVGYNVSNILTVNLRNLKTLGTVLDQMVTAGSNTIGGISFAVSDNKALVDEARKAAMADAFSKARLYAETANVCLARIVSISENNGYVPEPKMLRALNMEAVSDVPVASGEIGYSMTVTVNWELSEAPCE